MEKKRLLQVDGEDEIRKKVSEAMQPDENSDDSSEKQENKPQITEEQLRQYLMTHGKHGGTRVRKFDKVGRNDPCPCDSGKKFKKCCIDSVDAIEYNIVN